jgi:hypothetical protein
MDDMVTLIVNAINIRADRNTKNGGDLVNQDHIMSLLPSVMK